MDHEELSEHQMLHYILEDLQDIKRNLSTVLHILFTMDNTLDDLVQEVSDETTLDASIVTMLDNLEAQVTAAAGDPAKITAIFTGMKANAATLVSAITANTPAANTTSGARNNAGNQTSQGRDRNGNPTSGAAH